MISILSQFAHKAEVRESKDEMLVGEIVRAMYRRNCVSTGFFANNDYQRVRFSVRQDPVLHNVYITLNRLSGTGAISSAIFGSKATLTITAEIKNYISDPDDLLEMYRTDLANIFKLGVMGGIKLNHELNSVFATTSMVIEIDDYVLKGDPGVEKLVKTLSEQIGKLREKLQPYKKGSAG